MDHSQTSDSHQTRRAVLAAAAAVGALAPAAWAQPPAAQAHPSSARAVERLKTRRSFQFSVDVGTLDLGLVVAAAALAGGVDILEMGTPLLKTQGVANVVPAFRKRFPDTLLLADMKTMDGGGGEARSVFSGGANIIDFLAIAGVDSAKAICAVRDEFRRSDPSMPRLVFSDIIMPNTGTVAQAGEVALRMVDAGVDAVGVHLQVDARRANPKLIENDFLGEVALAVYERIGKAVPVQVVGGLYIAQAQRLARAGLPGFVISGNMGLPDGETRYNLPPAEIQRLVASFVSQVSSV
jgi:3-keto-L-gulonate-6-phosphate decarboxylase